MQFRRIVESECVEERYEAWSDYRNNLTEYIIRSIEDYYIREKLTSKRLRRLNFDYSIEDATSEYGKPVLAIWGAGGCNDIDINVLSKHFKLVLIDNNEAVVKKCIARYGLDSTQYVSCDLRFWDVSDDDYEMYEALMMEGAPWEEINAFLDELCNGMKVNEYNSINGIQLKGFNYSVVIGLASQLVSRFVAILHIYKDNYSSTDLEKIYIKLEKMSEIAVKRMFLSIMSTTRNMAIFGYEKEVVGEAGKVQGNNVLTELIGQAVEKDSLKCISKCNLNWNFAEEKSYVMENAAYVVEE